MAEPLPAYPAQATNDVDQTRWTASALRERLLNGAWRGDLETRVLEHFGRVRSEVVGPVSIALNAMRAYCRQVAVQADQEPTIACDEATEEQLETMEEWRPLRLHARLAYELVGLREYLIGVEWDAERDGPVIRIVSPVGIELEADPLRPTVPVVAREPVWRKVPGKAHADWVWRVWSIADAAAPSYQWMQRGPRGLEPIPELAGEALEGPAYPWRMPDGTAYLPWVLYHAEEPSGLWSTPELEELVQGTLTLGTLWSFWLHVAFDASWPQKVAINLKMAGGVPSADGLQRKIPMDPAIVLPLTSDGDSGQIATWGAVVDLLQSAEAVALYGRVLAESAGLTAADLQQTASATSGVSIQIRRDAIRRLQRPVATSMARADAELLSKIGALATAGGVPMPTEGWRVEYPAVSHTREELEERLGLDKMELEAGLTSRVAILMRRDGISREEALEQLRQYAADEAALTKISRAYSGAPTPPAQAGDPDPVDEESDDGGRSDDRGTPGGPRGREAEEAGGRDGAQGRGGEDRGGDEARDRRGDGPR